jgi:hypothetical protein
MSAVEAGHSIGKQRTKLAALLAFLAANGHPSLAPTWHGTVWIGKPRPRRPVRYVLSATIPRQPATRRSRRAR